MSKRSIHLVVLVVLLAALPAAAADRVIQRGIDPWTTIPEGTFADFSQNPLPAGFFCAESPAFTGQINLRGVALASDSPAALGSTDTIVERLDNAVFNKNGVATTRVRVAALQLTGVDVFKTACGDYYVQVKLAGEQPISIMRIVRESNRGGRFLVPLALNTTIVFTRVDDSSEKLEFAQPVQFPVNPANRWTYRQFLPTAKRVRNVTVDTDWDGTPDTVLNGTSNFAPYAGQFKVAYHYGHAVAE